jgi:ABC-type lipoprotein release transport system permease subunit
MTSLATCNPFCWRWPFSSASIMLFGLRLLACYIPARRAVRIDPMAALRHD